MSKKQLMKKLSFLFLPFCFTLSVNQCLSQVVQVRLDRIEIKEYDTIYIAIQPLFSNDTLEIIPITSTDNEFTIDYKFATGDNILSFEYADEVFSFEIELEAQKTDIDIKNPKNPGCLLKRRFHSCDASGLSTFGDGCLTYNYCITNYCDSGEGIEGGKVILGSKRPFKLRLFFTGKRRQNNIQSQFVEFSKWRLVFSQGSQ